MANEEEMESFDISEQDLYDALQPGKRRSKGLSKDQQIYGVFNYEEDREGPSSSSDRFGSFSAKKTKGKDYTAPVGFVKGGVQGGSQPKPGKAAESKQKLVSFSDSEEEGVDDMDNDADEQILQSLEGTGKIKGRPSVNAFKKGLTKQPPSAKSNDFSQNRYFGKDQKNPTGLGDWEKNTKGIGSKLLMKMGYQPGKGLGKSLQGRAQPVEAQVRKGRGAVGLYGAEHKNEPRTYVASDEEEERDYKEKLAHWKRDTRAASSEGKKAKTQFVYRTSEEVVEEATKGGVHKMAREYSEISKAKVIDMTGREQRVLSGYTALGARKTAEPSDEEKVSVGINKDKFQLEKFAYNLDTMVEFCEHEIIQNAKELSYNQDQVTAMEAEMKNMSAIVTKEVAQIGMLTAVLQALEELERKQAASLLDLSFLLDKFTSLEEKYPEEYESCDLANISLTYLIPLMKSRLAQFWRPFDSNSTDEDCRAVFKQWRPILEFRSKTPAGSRGSSAQAKKMDPYHALLWHAWMPAFRGLIGQWNCKNASRMVDLLEGWEPLLADWIMENILDQLILPRIQKEVDMWNPLTDLIPIHAWIHPWLPRLGSKLEIVYPIIRQKMAQALVGWTPSDQSARSVLLPWVPVFSKGAMDAFLVKNILPKLQMAIMKWDINPGQQQLDVWHWVMNWRDLMPTQSLISLLVDHFFPRWLHVLVTWLNHLPNYEEIVVWYTGWKSLFPQDIAQHPQIQEQFTRALDLMNRSLAVGGQVDLAPPPTVITPVIAAPQPPVMAEPVVPHGFRELVEYRCSQLGILCVPLVNRFQAGRPIFRVGNVLSYFDRQVAFVLVNNVWVPVSVQQLLEMAVST